MDAFDAVTASGYVPHQTAMEVMGWGMIALAALAIYFLFIKK